MNARKQQLAQTKGDVYTVTSIVIAGALFAFYALLRLGVWSQTVIFEDHDSIGLLIETDIFKTWNPSYILSSLSADTTILYPLTSAVLSFGNLVSTEFAARFTSFLSSLVLFLCFFRLLVSLKVDAVIKIASLVLISVHPVLLWLAPSVLTEPIYIAVVYLSFLYLFITRESLSAKEGVVSGLLFGLAFQARTEGFFFITTVPVLVGIYSLFRTEFSFSMKRFFLWALCFVAAFILVAAPQIMRVSQKTGELSINGRQVWNQMLYKEDKKTERYEETIYGVNLDEGQVNIKAALNNSALVSEKGGASSFSVIKILKNAKKNLSILKEEHDEVFFGKYGLLLILLGLIGIVIHKGKSGLFIVGFFAINLVGPMMHSFIVPRHVAVVTPFLMLFLVTGCWTLVRWLPFAWLRNSGVLILVGGLLFLRSWTIEKVFLPPTYNYEHSPAHYEPALNALRIDAENLGIKTPKVMSRRAYFPYMADAELVTMPYLNYEKLIPYARLRAVDYLFVQHEAEKDYPFVLEMQIASPGLIKVYEGSDAYHRPLELYRFERGA